MTFQPLARPTRWKSTFSTEMQFLLECLRARLHRRMARFDILGDARGFDWAASARMVERHLVLSHVCDALGGVAGGRVPDHLLSEMNSRRQVHVRRVLAMTSELLRLAALFDERGIRFMPFKGPVLSAALFGNVAYRTCGDLDILVHPDDEPGAEDVLLANGYRPAFETTGFSDSRLRIFRNNYHHRLFTGTGQGVVVEIHWRLLASQAVKGGGWDPQGMFQRGQPVPIAGRVFRTLGDTDLLNYLCVHGGNHFWERLSWLCDVAEIFRGFGDGQWRAAQRAARACGAGRALALAAVLSHDLLETEVPGGIRDQWKRDPLLPVLLDNVYRKMNMTGYGESPSMPYGMASFVLKAALAPGVEGMATHMARALNIPVDWRTVPLPDSLHFLYLPLRPVLWLYRQIQALSRAAASGEETGDAWE